MKTIGKWEEVIPPFERVIKDLQDLEKERNRWRLLEEVKAHKRNNRNALTEARAERTLIREAQDWMRNNQLTITREDKSKKITILKKDIYDNYLMNYINETGAECLERDPTNALDKRVRKFLKNKSVPDFMKVRKITNPSCPRIFAYAKTHKTPLTFRPIVEKCRSPTYNLEKRITKWINMKINNYTRVIPSSQAFLKELKKMQLQGNEVLTTYDFEKLYPSINIAPACLCLYRFLIENLHSETFSLDTCRELADMLCYCSYFRFQNKFYKQTKGVPIGSPLAGVLAELVIRSLEQPCKQ